MSQQAAVERQVGWQVSSQVYDLAARWVFNPTGSQLASQVSNQGWEKVWNPFWNPFGHQVRRHILPLVHDQAREDTDGSKRA